MLWLKTAAQRGGRCIHGKRKWEMRSKPAPSRRQIGETSARGAEGSRDEFFRYKRL